jgi:hypothetical protein
MKVEKKVYEKKKIVGYRKAHSVLRSYRGARILKSYSPTGRYPIGEVSEDLDTLCIKLGIEFRSCSHMPIRATHRELTNSFKPQI